MSEQTCIRSLETWKEREKMKEGKRKGEKEREGRVRLKNRMKNRDSLSMCIRAYVSVCTCEPLKEKIKERKKKKDKEENILNAGKCKVMLLNGEEGLECQVHIDGVRLEHFSQFKYLGCVFDE